MDAGDALGTLRIDRIDLGLPGVPAIRSVPQIVVEGVVELNQHGPQDVREDEFTPLADFRSGLEVTHG